MKNKVVNIVSCNYARAILLKSLLESVDVETYLSDINLIQPDVSGGVKVFVKEKDMEKALEVINNFTKEFYSDEDETLKKIQKINKILIPVDFSTNSYNACLYALEVAKKLKAEIKLFHAYYNPASVANPFPDSFSYQIGSGALLEDIEELVKQKIKELKNKLTNELKDIATDSVKITASVSLGIPIDEIQEAIKKYKPGLVIMGTSGVSERKSEFVGSVTNKIIDKSKVPVLAIPKHAKYEGEVIKVLYATDFEDSDFSSFRKLMNIISPFNVEVKCIHIGESKKNTFDKFKMEKLHEHLAKHYPGFNVECVILQGKDAAASINKYVDNNNIKLLAITSRRRSYIEKLFHHGVTKEILFHTKIPMMVFHVNEK